MGPADYGSNLMGAFVEFQLLGANCVWILMLMEGLHISLMSALQRVNVLVDAYSESGSVVFSDRTVDRRVGEVVSPSEM